MLRSVAIALEFRILGPLEVVSEGEALALGGAKQRAVLALLLLRPNEPVSVDRIVDELWGERPPATAAKNVQVYVSHLRKALGEGVLTTVPPGYALTVDAATIDANRAAEALALATEGPAPERVALLNEALGLWRGPALPELADMPFAQAEILRLEELRLQLQKRRIDADLDLGRHDAAVPELEKLVAAHPLDEGLCAQLMLALYRSGRQADALAVYRDARRTLTSELGLEPGDDLRALEQRILAHDPALRPARAEPTSRAALRGRPTRVMVVVGGVLVTAALAAGVIALTGDASRGVVAPSNSVAVVDPDRGAVIASIPVGHRPDQVVSGAGFVWASSLEDKTLARIDPRTLRVTKTVGLGFEPTDLAADRDHVWVVGGYDHKIWRVDSDGEARLKLDFEERFGPLPPGYERGPAGVAVHGTSVWLSHGDEVTEFDADSGAIRRTIRAGGDGTARSRRMVRGSGWATTTRRGLRGRSRVQESIRSTCARHASSIASTSSPTRASSCSTRGGCGRWFA